MTPPPPEPQLLPPSQIPMELILVEILPKLPVKTLHRFKTVCKTFKTVISSPGFTHHHLRNFLIIPASDRTLNAYSWPEFNVSSPPSSTFSWPQSSVYVSGSCNGLLLITRHPETPLLLNPLTRTYIDVHGCPSMFVNERSFGVGFDHVGNDYKVVCVYDYYGSAIGGFGNLTRVTRVYSVSSKSWKLVGNTRWSYTTVKRCGVLFKNHLLHWPFCDALSGRIRIGCFDVCCERWMDDLLLPDFRYGPYGFRKYKFPDLGVLDNKLFALFDNYRDSCYDVWVMNEYGVKESWVKLMSVTTIDAPYDRVVPIACRDDSSEVLFWQREKAMLVWYNRNDGLMIRAEVPRIFRDMPYVCEGSFVTLPGAKPFVSICEANQ